MMDDYSMAMHKHESGVAMEAGIYSDFTGWLKWGDTDAYVEEAYFSLSEDRISMDAGDGMTVRNVRWLVGRWIGGTFSRGEWLGGEWMDGTWNGGRWSGGVWHNGVWENGLWLDGDWHEGIWMNGFWSRGRCIDVITGRWRATNEDPYRFKLRRNKEWKS